MSIMSMALNQCLLKNYFLTFLLNCEIFSQLSFNSPFPIFVMPLYSIFDVFLSLQKCSFLFSLYIFGYAFVADIYGVSYIQLPFRQKKMLNSLKQKVHSKCTENPTTFLEYVSVIVNRVALN